MIEDIIKGKWNEIKGGIKQKWAELNEDDITQIEGSYNELIGILQKKYGYSKDKASNEIKEFLKKINLLD